MAQPRYRLATFSVADMERVTGVTANDVRVKRHRGMLSKPEEFSGSDVRIVTGRHNIFTMAEIVFIQDTVPFGVLSDAVLAGGARKAAAKWVGYWAIEASIRRQRLDLSADRFFLDESFAATKLPKYLLFWPGKPSITVLSHLPGSTPEDHLFSPMNGRSHISFGLYDLGERLAEAAGLCVEAIEEIEAAA